MLVLALAVALTACGKAGSQPAENGDAAAAPSLETQPKSNGQEIIFPAYKLDNPQKLDDIDQINDAEKFMVHVDFPENWALKDAMGSETIPTGEFFTLRYIYDAAKLIGYIGFHPFEPYTDEIAQEDYYKTVYPTLRLSSFFAWDPYVAVKTTDTGETGIADVWYLDPNEIEKHPGAMPDVPHFETLGILSYEKTRKAYIGIAFMPGAVDRTQAEEIAKSIVLTALDESK